MTPYRRPIQVWITLVVTLVVSLACDPPEAKPGGKHETFFHACDPASEVNDPSRPTLTWEAGLVPGSVVRWHPFDQRSTEKFGAGLRWIQSWVLNNRTSDLENARTYFAKPGDSQVYYLYWAFVEDKLGHPEKVEAILNTGHYPREVYDFYFNSRDLISITDYHLMDLCNGNFQRFHEALGKYAKDHEGLYPKQLSELVPSYLPSLPNCPASGRETYSEGYKPGTDHHSWTLTCSQHDNLNHGPLIGDFTPGGNNPPRRDGLIDEYKIYHMLLGGFMDRSRQVEWVQPLLKDGGVEAGMTVADVGSGPGMFTFPFAEAVGKDGKVYAVDINKSVLEYVTATAARRTDVHVETILTRSVDVGLPEATIDRLFVIQTYHAMVDFAKPDDPANYEANLKPWLASMKRAIKPGGYLIIQDIHVPIDITRKQVEGMGFTTIKSTGYRDRNYILVFERP